MHQPKGWWLYGRLHEAQGPSTPTVYAGQVYVMLGWLQGHDAPVLYYYYVVVMLRLIEWFMPPNQATKAQVYNSEPG